MDFKAFLDTFQKKEVNIFNHQVKENPMVSVCIQTYNHENYIKKCLDGILSQETNFTFEILIGEDASTDKTREICIDYAKKFPDKIKLILHHRANNIKIHGNPSGRFNFLYNIFSASGKYIAFCDGDDYWIDNQKLQKQVDFLESNEDYVVAWTNYKTFNGKDFIDNQFGFTEPTRTIDFNTIFRPYCTLTLTVLFEKSALDLTNIETFDYFKDNTLYALLLKKGKGIFMDFVSAVYREHEGGVYALKSDYFKNYSSYLNIKEIMEFIPEANTNNMRKVLNSLGNATAFGLLKMKKAGEDLTEDQVAFMNTYFKNGNLKTKFKYFKRRYLK